MAVALNISMIQLRGGTTASIQRYIDRALCKGGGRPMGITDNRQAFCY